MASPTLTERVNTIQRQLDDLALERNSTVVMQNHRIQNVEKYLDELKLELAAIRTELSLVQIKSSVSDTKSIAHEKQIDRIYQIAPLLIAGLSLFVSTVIGLLVPLRRK